MQFENIVFIQGPYWFV